MKKFFCPKCGNETDNLYESLCESCYSSKFKKNIFRKKMNVSICNCGSVGHIENWKKDRSLEDFIDMLIKNDLKSQYMKKFSGFELSLEKEKYEEMFIVEAIVKKENIVIAKHIYRIHIRHRSCPECSSFKKGYYEAVLQLRGKKETLDLFYKIVEETMNSYTGDNSFAKIVAQKDNAIDMHLGTKNILNKLKKRISSKFNVEFKTTFAQYKIKDGKEIHRTTLLVREK